MTRRGGGVVSGWQAFSGLRIQGWGFASKAGPSVNARKGERNPRFALRRPLCFLHRPPPPPFLGSPRAAPRPGGARLAVPQREVPQTQREQRDPAFLAARGFVFWSLLESRSLAEAQGGGPAKEPAEAGDEPADSQVLARQVLVRAVPKSRPGCLDVCSERCWLGLSALIEASSRCGDSRPSQDRIQGQCGSAFHLS